MVYDVIEATTLKGYDTAYRDEGKTVYLSNDGSVYKAPYTLDGEILPSDPYVPAAEELLAYIEQIAKLAEVPSDETES